MRYVSDYVHSRGLKFGMYSCNGVRTCADYPGSFDHEFLDARTFAEYGVDYLKYDNCYRPGSADQRTLYRRMGMALRASGRDIVFSACNWGQDDVWSWIRSTGASLYRSTGDIFDTPESYRNIARSQMDKLGASAPGCFNDMDMLVAGMYGQGSNPETTSEGCSFEEYQTHFALWAMLNSPLIIGCDLRHLDPSVKALLQNRDLIAINQDPEARTCYKLTCPCSPDAFTLVRPLAGGDYAVGIFNFAENEQQAGFPFWDLGLSARNNQRLHFYDCLSHQDLGTFTECFSAKVPAHGCRIYRVSLVPQLSVNQ
jgi:alpha-galactosidase